jgi:hypothetical protein
MRFASQFALQQVSLFDDGEILYQGVTNPSSNYNNQKYVYQIKENGKFYTYMAVLCCPNMTLDAWDLLLICTSKSLLCLQ